MLALESNGLRVLVRVGLGAESKSYAATYRSVREALRGQLPRRAEQLAQAHLLLRRHGLEVCRRSAPACGACVLRRSCAFFAARQ